MSKKKARYENRSYAVEGLRLEKRESGEGHVLRGHAAVFDTLSHPLFFFREKIDPGAFKESIKNDDIRALWMHDSSIVLGRNTASPSTLTLTEDDRGLNVEIDLPDTQAGRDAVVSIERGDVREMSFGFFTQDDRWETQDGEQIRTLESVQLFDVSPVSFPQYPNTDIGVAQRMLAMRSMGADPQVVIDSFEASLRTDVERIELEVRARLDHLSRRIKLIERNS